MQAILIVVELLVAIGLIVTVLLQRSEGGALGMGGGGSGLGGLFSPRGAADTLTRATAFLAALFILTCIALDVLPRLSSGNQFWQHNAAPAPTAPAQNPVVPSGGHPAPTVPTPH